MTYSLGCGAPLQSRFPPVLRSGNIEAGAGAARGAAKPRLSGLSRGVNYTSYVPSAIARRAVATARAEARDGLRSGCWRRVEKVAGTGGGSGRSRGGEAGAFRASPVCCKTAAQCP
ncbi:hypothetical protein dqs_3937 [Azoarcus olearius]|nr:hypothetical protein dqs_3937 [Azoarcus olearius]